MIIVCEKCGSKLQIEDVKIPRRPFTIKCPKCETSIEAGTAPNPALEQSGATLGYSPSTEDPKQDFVPTPAPLFELDLDNPPDVSGVAAVEKLAELLSGLMSPRTGSVRNPNSGRPAWNPRRALICVAPEVREKAARCLAEKGYQVFVAEDTKQAVDRMRENQLDVVVLDPRFDPVEQGPVFVTREVSVMRPVQRRRLFFVQLSPSVRTMDTHTAFLNNVNAVVNVKDVEELPVFIEQRIREFNELYSEFNNVLGVPAL